VPFLKPFTRRVKVAEADERGAHSLLFGLRPSLTILRHAGILVIEFIIAGMNDKSN